MTHSQDIVATDAADRSLHESSFRRVRRTYRTLVTSFSYGLWVASLTLVFGAAGAYLTAQDDYQPRAVAAITLASGAVGLIAGLISAFIAMWVGAPRQQRDEARQEVARLNLQLDELTAVRFRVELDLEPHPGLNVRVWDRTVTDVHYLTALVVNEGPTSDFEARIPRTKGFPASWGATYQVFQPEWEHTTDSIVTIAGGGSGGRRRLMLGVVAMTPREFWFNTVQSGTRAFGYQLQLDAQHPGQEWVIEFDLEVVNAQHGQFMRKTCRVTIPVNGSPIFEEIV